MLVTRSAVLYLTNCNCCRSSVSRWPFNPGGRPKTDLRRLVEALAQQPHPSGDGTSALVIDPGTWGRAQPGAEDFEKRPDVPIRGRRETQDVYALPLRAHSV